jgi:hypothetical protein
MNLRSKTEQGGAAMSLNRELLAELELTMVPSTRPRPDDGLRGWSERETDRSGGQGSRRRRFWCAVKKQDVEVEFETRKRLGIPRIVDVRRCTVFDRPTEVACGRHCLDASFRNRRPFSPPLVIPICDLGD